MTPTPATEPSFCGYFNGLFCFFGGVWGLPFGLGLTPSNLVGCFGGLLFSGGKRQQATAAGQGCEQRFPVQEADSQLLVAQHEAMLAKALPHPSPSEVWPGFAASRLRGFASISHGLPSFLAKLMLC